MEDILLNDDFIDFVNSQMEKYSYNLEKIYEYKKYNKEYSQINEIIDKTVDKNLKMFLDKIITCTENMSSYENAFAYYLGMKQSLNMLQLEKTY